MNSKIIKFDKKTKKSEVIEEKGNKYSQFVLLDEKSKKLIYNYGRAALAERNLESHEDEFIFQTELEGSLNNAFYGDLN